MFELCRAEWIKVVGHRRVLVYLLGIFPIGAMLILSFVGLLAWSDPSSHDEISMFFSNWTDLLLNAWMLPNMALCRVFLVAFTAFTFAGEYQWGTWKNIMSRQNRAALVLVKFFVLSVLVLASFTLTSFIIAAGGSLVATIAGVDLSPAFSLEQVLLVLPDYLLSAGMTFLAFLITAIVAALASIYSRSILGGTLAGIVLILAEMVLFMLPNWASKLFEMPDFLHLQRGIPLYNIENIRSWIQSGVASEILDKNFLASGLAPPGDGALFSVAIVAGWILLGVGAVVLVFEKQDIMT